ncbi:hypothetical protein O6P43_027181 [Quillaja saponaria]|uniref:Uncharacterized protein n=1 Tax=Quillaja saponaria TaxID=32244 RepID=A0AAD7L4A3_QUISA|nr:hypothetical protein O6P43_027181 [Quillaja saponaria]
MGYRSGTFIYLTVSQKYGKTYKANMSENVLFQYWLPVYLSMLEFTTFRSKALWPRLGAWASAQSGSSTGQ